MQAVYNAQVLLSLRVIGVAVSGTILCFLLGCVLLLEDVKIGIDAVIGHWFRSQQFVEILPLCLESIVLVVSSRDGGNDGDEAIDYL